MRQLVTVDQFGPAVWVAAGALLLAGTLTIVLGTLRRPDRRWKWRGLALVAAGVALGLAWPVFLWSVRIDPTARYVGLYRPGVIAADVLAFLAVGLGLGLLFRWAWTLKEEKDNGGRNNTRV